MIKIYTETDSLKTPALLTSWSLVHLLSGSATMVIINYLFDRYNLDTDNLIILNLIISNIIHASFELNDFNTTYITRDRIKQNSIINIIGDTIVFNIGFWIANVTSKEYRFIYPVLYLLVLLLFVYFGHFKNRKKI